MENTNVSLRYAPYIENAHVNFLNTVRSDRNKIIDNSPFIGHTKTSVDEAFIGTGYILGSFPALYDMFGKHMTGLDVEVVWDTAAREAIDEGLIAENIREELNLVNTEADSRLMDFVLHMRDSNSINSSTFITGKAVLEDSRIKLLSNVGEVARLKHLPMIQDKFTVALNWNKETVRVYAESMKLYYLSKMEVEAYDYTMVTRDILWPFVVLGFEMVSLGALRGTGVFNKTMDRPERSKLSKGLLILSNVATGAYVGSQIYPGIGTVVGAVVGLIVGIAIVLFE